MRRILIQNLLVVVLTLLCGCQGFVTVPPLRRLNGIQSRTNVGVRSLQAVQWQSPSLPSFPSFSRTAVTSNWPSWQYSLQYTIRKTQLALDEWSVQFLRYVRRLVGAFVVAASSLGGIGGHRRQAAFASSAVAVTAMTAMPRAAEAGVFRKYRDLSPYQKLATTPLFYVCSSGGSPYLQDDVQAGKPEQRIIVYFMSSEDANDYLNELAQGNPQNTNEFRVMTVSMEKVVKKIQSKKQSRKLGRYKMASIIRIQPSSRQCENADKVGGAGGATKAASKRSSATRGISIPMFTAKGLALRRANGEIVTPYYFALEDLKEDWEQLVEDSVSEEEEQAARAAEGASAAGAGAGAGAGKGKEKSVVRLPVKPKVEVRDFVEVMCACQGVDAESLRAHLAGPSSPTGGAGGADDKATDVKKATAVAAAKSTKDLPVPGIVPPRREIEMIRRFYRNEAGEKNEFQEARIIGAK